MELRLYLPKSWVEIKPRQLRFISFLFVNQTSEPEFLIKAFMFLTGLKLVRTRKGKRDGARWFKHGNLKRPFLIKPDVLSTMADKCRFLLQPGEVKPLPYIRFAKARHYRLFNCCFEEYLMAENYYFAYVQTKDPVHLDNLIAVLYRRPWQKWNAGKIQKRARKFRTLDEITKNAVFMWYIGFRTYVPKRCKTLFGGEKSGGGSFNPRNYINGMIHQLTNGDITLKRELLKQPAWDALDELEQRAQEAEQMKPKKK